MRCVMNRGEENPTEFLVSFIQLYNAASVAACVILTPDQAVKVSLLLLDLEAANVITAPSVVVKSRALDLDQFRALLGSGLDEIVVASIEASGEYCRTHLVKPAALMPVWGFDDAGSDASVLEGVGHLWGVDVRLEALRMEDMDLPKPLPGAKARFEAWRKTIGPEHAFATVSLPEREGHYVLVAWS